MSVRRLLKRLSVSSKSQVGPPIPEGDTSSPKNDRTVEETVNQDSGGLKARTFHHFEEAGYTLPNDDEEQTRLKLQHNVIKMMLGDRNYPPDTMKDPKTIVDIGCGTGTWVVEVAKEFPSATVHGLDLSDIQPKDAPSNVKWHTVNVCNGLPFEPGTVDFIQIRILPTLHERITVLKSCKEALRSGGVLFLVELSSDYSSNGIVSHAKEEFYTLRTKALERQQGGKLISGSGRIGKLIRGMVEDLGGFRDITWATKEIPVGPWIENDERMKKIGAMQLQNCLYLLESFAAGMISKLNLDPAKVNTLYQKAIKELQEPHRHIYWPYDFVWGYKL